MPFLAHTAPQTGTTNKLVTPEEVPNGEDVFCPECGERMRPRGGSRKKARHFFHIKSVGGEGGCSGFGGNMGESERHQIMKSLAASGLRTYYADTETVESCATEVTVDVSHTSSETSIRRADVLIKLENTNQFFGCGVVVEVQHANETKNIPQVTADYLQAEFSVMWATEQEFTDDRFCLDRFEQAFQQRDGTAFAPYFAEPDDIWSTFDPAEWFDLPSGWQFEDPNTDCNHEFEAGHDAAQCLRCGTQYQQHTESQLPLYAEDTSWIPSDKPIIVKGERGSFVPDGQPHVHSWRRNGHGERSHKSECSKCRAKKLSTNQETIIDYESYSFDSVESRRMKQCHHEWRRTGSGEECWKCGKPKPDNNDRQW